MFEFISFVKRLHSSSRLLALLGHKPPISPAMTSLTPEQRELQLVESVEFKILAVANDEVKLCDLLGRYLAPIILKAESSNPAVRVKVTPFQISLCLMIPVAYLS